MDGVKTKSQRLRKSTSITRAGSAEIPPEPTPLPTRVTRGKQFVLSPSLQRGKIRHERQQALRRTKILKATSFTAPGPASSKSHLNLNCEPVSKKQYEEIVQNQPVVLTKKIDEELEKYPTAMEQLKEIPKDGSEPLFISVEEEMAKLNSENDDNHDDDDKNPNSVVCRVCGVAGPDRFSIIGAKADRLQLRANLTKYLNMKILEDENLPLYICQLCYQTVATFNSFHKRFVVATNRLKAIVKENSEIYNVPWYGDNVIAKCSASVEYLMEKKKANETPKPQTQQFLKTTNIEKLFGTKKAGQKIVMIDATQNAVKRKAESDDDVQIITPPPAKKAAKNVPKNLTPIGNSEALSASLGSGKAILIPISTPPGTPGGGNRYLIATPQNTSNVGKPVTSNIISTAASAAGITPIKIGKKFETPRIIAKKSTPVKKVENRIITSDAGHVDLVDLKAITEGKTNAVKTTPTSVVKPTMQLIVQPQQPGRVQFKSIISPTQITKIESPKPPEPAIEPWSKLPFRAPAKDDKYTYVVRMDRKPGDQPYFILTANPTKLSAGPELTRQNVGIICKDVYRAEVAKNKARSSNGNFSNIGLHSWAQHIIWLRTLSNFDGDIKPYLKESADKVLEYGNRKPKIIPRVVKNTTVVPKDAEQKLFLIPITTMGADGKPVQTFQVANVVPQPSTSSASPIKTPPKLLVNPTKNPTKTTPVQNSPGKSSPLKPISQNKESSRTEIIYQNEENEIFDMECTSEHEEDEEEEPMEEERLEEDDDDEGTDENFLVQESEIVAETVTTES